MSIKNTILAAALSAAVTLGSAGGLLIQNSEGRVLEAYRDPVGIWTICYGHTGPDVYKGVKKTAAECEAIFLQDVAKHQTVLYGKQSCVGTALKPKTNRADAVLSLVFNIGNTKFCASTLARYLREGKPDAQVAAEFSKWVYAGKTVLPGLVTRRAAERSLFLSKKEWTPYVVKGLVVR